MGIYILACLNNKNNLKRAEQPTSDQKAVSSF